MPIVVWYDFEMISRKSTVGARECVSFIHYDITYGEGCIAWNASVHICWSPNVMAYCCNDDDMIFLFFVHAYISYFFRHICNQFCWWMKYLYIYIFLRSWDRQDWSSVWLRIVHLSSIFCIFRIFLYLLCGLQLKKVFVCHKHIHCDGKNKMQSFCTFLAA